MPIPILNPDEYVTKSLRDAVSEGVKPLTGLSTLKQVAFHNRFQAYEQQLYALSGRIQTHRERLAEARNIAVLAHPGNEPAVEQSRKVMMYNDEDLAKSTEFLQRQFMNVGVEHCKVYREYRALNEGDILPKAGLVGNALEQNHQIITARAADIPEALRITNPKFDAYRQAIDVKTMQMADQFNPSPQPGGSTTGVLARTQYDPKLGQRILEDARKAAGFSPNAAAASSRNPKPPTLARSKSTPQIASPETVASTSPTPIPTLPSLVAPGGPDPLQLHQFPPRSSSLAARLLSQSQPQPQAGPPPSNAMPSTQTSSRAVPPSAHSPPQSTVAPPPPAAGHERNGTENRSTHRSVFRGNQR